MVENARDEWLRAKEHDTMTDNDEQSIPSRGSHGEPVGWQATDEFGRPSGFLSWKDDETRWPNNESVPLYLAPQPALTDGERECLQWAEEIAGNCEEFDRVNTLRNLLERTK